MLPRLIFVKKPGIIKLKQFILEDLNLWIFSVIWAEDSAMRRAR